MKDLMGIIYLNKPEQDGKLPILTRNRCIASLPIWSKFRLIDFILTNMVQSGIENIALLSTIKYRALINHLQGGAAWGLDKKRDGLFIFIPTMSQSSYNLGHFDFQLLSENIDHIKKSHQDYLVFAPGNLVGNIDFQWLLNFHKKQEKDITYVRPGTDYASYSKDLSEDGYYQMHPIFLISKSLMVKLIREYYYTNFNGSITDLMTSSIRNNGLTINEVNYPNLNCITNMENYFNFSMNILETPEMLTGNMEVPVTKKRDLPPTRYYEGCEISQSLIAEGCHIKGEVNSSIIFHSVSIERGTQISNSIIFPETIINENSLLNEVIADKQVYISENKQLINSSTKPLVLSKQARV
ncbi:glucose-1-phosphate adenylyltransferase subunit GlgD [Natranaerobius thermophilus]|uniref:Glucose-1-phosphate adenylyltransferase, GlgD subunit n=1 Tax=Natranaerobius thermophilus (strain ATCC BAA-1301 / DSM 18059 / JW/NM-WN-LF) TaxID=457570 RepID=B2A6E5_NATTJ|nr:glucose-1-phosphate adenylyltransferase subunit GlgD [Natranaerobius thermophilus]ACB84156.1 glucose-1-phosphate adenylyltransferase, GlgD subunit [Natranaerobius thermophilus JW/NM-WN-LF]